MEIHGNTCTVWSVWGAEYQSSVSREHRSFIIRGISRTSGELWDHADPPTHWTPGLQRKRTEAAPLTISTEGQAGGETDTVLCFFFYSFWTPWIYLNLFCSHNCGIQKQWRLWSRRKFLFLFFLHVDISVIGYEQTPSSLRPECQFLFFFVLLKPAWQQNADRCLVQDWISSLHNHLIVDGINNNNLPGQMSGLAFCLNRVNKQFQF